MSEAGDAIEPPGGVWSFKEPHVAEVFDRHVALSVPEYDYVQGLIGKLSTYFLIDGGSVVDYGCATGRTLEEVARANPSMRVRLIGVDESASMCTKAHDRIQAVWNGRFDIHNLRLAMMPPPADTCLLLSVYTLQFLSPAARSDALKMMASSVQSGTGFILVEKTVPDESLFVTPFSEIHYDEKLERYSATEVVSKARSLRGVLRPLPAEETEELLTAAGWRYQRFWQHLAFVGWVCVR